MKLEKNKKVKIRDPHGRMLIVDIYPVGLWAEVQNSWRSRKYKFHFKSMWRQFKRHEFRNFKNSFNGYLAEPDVFTGKLRRCGSGWTRKRALRDLQRRVKRS